MDSCGGFLGDFEEMIPEIKSIIDCLPPKEAEKESLDQIIGLE